MACVSQCKTSEKIVEKECVSMCPKERAYIEVDGATCVGECSTLHFTDYAYDKSAEYPLYQCVRADSAVCGNVTRADT